MNDESLGRANALLAAVAEQVSVGEVWSGVPSDLGRSSGIDDPLAVARAMRALLSRGRLQAVGDGYRLVEARPIEAGEKGTNPPRKRAPRTLRSTSAPVGEGDPTYSDLGRQAIERLIELGNEVATLRAEVRGAREEVRTSRAARIEAEQRSEGFASRVRELEARAEMAEVNLRTLLAAARNPGKDGPVATNEMEAILGVLKGEASA